MSRRPYLSSDDSEFLRGVLSKYSGESCLEIGAGNGGTLAALAERFCLVVGTDIVPPLRSVISNMRVNYVLADTANCFGDQSFDLVTFNPPYLPSAGIEDPAVDGGKGGAEVPLLFLREALRVVKTSGRVILLLSSQNPLEGIESECVKSGFELRRIAEKKLFFEELYVFEAARHRG
jgi:release factor glutamine methyltransferase